MYDIQGEGMQVLGENREGIAEAGADLQWVGMRVQEVGGLLKIS